MVGSVRRPSRAEKRSESESEKAGDAPKGGALQNVLVHPSSRPEQVTLALRLSQFTIIWNGVIGTAARVVGTLTGSLALGGFALSALLDVSASAILVWRFSRERTHPEAAEHLERRAQAFIGLAMTAVALYITIQALRALGEGAHAHEAAVGIVLAFVSLLVLPWLAQTKLRLASALAGRALRGDGVLTLAGAALAGITLLALLLTRTLGWWWAEPAAALLIGGAVATEASRVIIHHRFG
jgi:divalent metal cation (Fe/Co/Zn/Cd) transporter